jgi:glycine/D-amino acid oxidase-like deaminating enzyme
MSQTFDIVIVGAGIVGAACAAECAGAGLKALVVDRGRIAGGTTAAGMGHIVVMDDSEAQFALTRYSRDLWIRLRPQLPVEVEFELCGTLWVAADDEEMEEVRRKEKFYSQRGVRVEVLDAADLKKLEPNLRDGLVGGLRVHDDGVLYPPSAAQFLLNEATSQGVKLRTDTEVAGLLSDGGVILADGSRVTANRVVNAAGPWSPSISPGLPIRKRKGHLIITDRCPGLVSSQIVELGYLKSAHSMNEDSVAFNIQPRRSGQMLVGSSRQFNADDDAVQQPILDRMWSRALEFLPSLGKISVSRVWAGHRAATPDKLPIIGPSAENERLWFATGHEGLGITMSLGTGRLLVDMLLGRPTAIPSEPYLPARFADRRAG